MALQIWLSLYTANDYRGLQGLYGEIGVWRFQIYGDCMLPAIPVIFEVNTLCGLLKQTLSTLNYDFYFQIFSIAFFSKNRMIPQTTFVPTF